MSRSSSSSFDEDIIEETGRVLAGGASALGPAPMPSLSSHPPLRLQRKPVPGSTLKRLQGSASPFRTQLPPITPTLEEFPVHRPTSPVLMQENSGEEVLLPCPFCPAMFKKVGHLNRHTLKHAGTRFSCEVSACNKTFSRLDNMRTQYVLSSPFLPVSTE